MTNQEPHFEAKEEARDLVARWMRSTVEDAAQRLDRICQIRPDLEPLIREQYVV